MKQLAVYSLLVVMLALAGCPLKTKNSVDVGSYDVPAWLPGTWWELDSNGKKTSGHYFEKTNKKGNLTCYDTDSLGRHEAEGKPAILSSVAGKIYMSIYDGGAEVSEEGYYLFEFRKVSNNEFTLRGIKEHALEYEAEPKEIIKFLENNKGSDDIFDPAETIRLKKK